MNLLNQLFQSDIVQALGWTMIHSLWQGLLIVLLLTISLIALRKHSSQIRYLVGFIALLALTFCSIGTFTWTFANLSADKAVGIESAYLPDSAIESSAVFLSRESQTIAENYWRLLMGSLENYLPFFVMIWMLGVLVLTLRFLAELAYVQRLTYKRGQLSVASHQEVLQKLAKKMGVQKYVELKESIRINSPMVIGFVKPVILTPLGLLSSLSPGQVESILAHELAHIKRYDYALNLCQSLVEIILFFNPATWWISSFIRSEREHCCDDMAIEITGNQLVFVQTLAKLEEYRAKPGNIAMAFNSDRNSGVLGRVKRILNSEEQFKLPYKLFWSCVILLSSLGLLAFQNQQASAQVLPQPQEITLEAPASEKSEDRIISDRDIEKRQAQNDEKEEQNSFEDKKDGKKPNIETLPLTQVSVAAPLGEEKAVEAEKTYIRPDTVPKTLIQLETELMQLKKSYREKELALQKQSSQIQSEIRNLERQLQKMENEQLKGVYELEKKSQEIELKRNTQQQELAINLNAFRSQTLELEYQIKKTGLELSEKANKSDQEDEYEQLRRQMQNLNRQKLEMEKQKQDLEIAQQRKNLELEKEMQLLVNKRWQIEKEVELQRSGKQLEMLELRQKLRDIELKNQLLQSENQHKIQLLQEKFKEEINKEKGKKN